MRWFPCETKQNIPCRKGVQRYITEMCEIQTCMWTEVTGKCLSSFLHKSKIRSWLKPQVSATVLLKCGPSQRYPLFYVEDVE